MRRWNGWGDDTIIYELPEKAGSLLHQWMGHSHKPHDVTLADLLTAVPASKLPEHSLIHTDSEIRVRHARGQSLPDMLALRSGQHLNYPDGVARPTNEAELLTLLKFAKEMECDLIPYGGGTSVVGHVNPNENRPTLTVNLQRLNQLRRFDETSQLATFGAGIQGPDLEAQLRAKGFTLGHFPQSFELSTLGGWIATRSSGQQSLGYGRIEDLFSGGKLLSPMGALDLPPFPASAAGPDLRQLVLGSEGRLGIISEATVRVTPLPEVEEFHAVFFPDFEAGLTAVRQIAQSGLPLSMLRLSTAVETTTTLALAGHDRLIGTLEKVLSLRGAKDEKCMLMLGFTGNHRLVKTAKKEAFALTSDNHGVHVGKQFGKQWQKGRFRTPYLRNSLWEVGYAVDTLETAVNWSTIPQMIMAVEQTLKETAAKFNEKIHVFTHLSHVYSDGASVYTTYLFRLAADPAETLARWQKMKTAVSQAIVANRGTISHQHGVGVDHAPYLSAEKGNLGIQALKTAANQFDPTGIMNPGKLISQAG